MDDKVYTEADFRARRAYEIQRAKRIIDGREAFVLELAKAYVPDFHFMRHEVSMVWTCETSDIGMCVFEKDYDDRWGEIVIGNCIYCGKPKVRK